jgi:hypothetical protein
MKQQLGTDLKPRITAGIAGHGILGTYGRGYVKQRPESTEAF